LHSHVFNHQEIAGGKGKDKKTPLPGVSDVFLQAVLPFFKSPLMLQGDYVYKFSHLAALMG